MRELYWRRDLFVILNFKSSYLPCCECYQASSGGIQVGVLAETSFVAIRIRICSNRNFMAEISKTAKVDQNDIQIALEDNIFRFYISVALFVVNEKAYDTRLQP